MDINYKINQPISTDQFIAILNSSSLGERRPMHSRECMEGMNTNGNLAITAWDESKLIGIARSVTDFHFACYLSDLAVDQHYQKQGIGKRLQQLTQDQLGPECKLILLSAPAAQAYYQHIGYTTNERCWVLNRSDTIAD